MFVGGGEDKENALTVVLLLFFCRARIKESAKKRLDEKVLTLILSSHLTFLFSYSIPPLQRTLNLH